ncbi:MAG TPA: DUF2157 domain-containing protein [Myxococcota bacterium]|nr:DUF2157 domain-containing protein [Myxococcota bacterium]
MDSLERWQRAGLLDEAAVARIRAFEAEQGHESRFGWPVRIAIALGGVLLGAGILLFVEAQWDALSPLARFALVLAMVGGFHAAGAYTLERFPVLGLALHALGSVSLGAGIFLCGQIFNLDEHWPGGVLLWAVGATAGLALVRSWPQLALTALLWPAWIGSEWIVRTELVVNAARPLAAGWLLLAIAYLTALTPDLQTPARRSLHWIGLVAFWPLLFFAMAAASESSHAPNAVDSPSWLAGGWLLAIGLPLAVGYGLHGARVWTLGIAAAWVVILVAICANAGGSLEKEPLVYVWCGLGAIGMIAWGVTESLPSRINLGIALFGVTLVVFYFTNVFDKLERSASLVVMGVVFIGAGVLLERTRRRLVRRVSVTP